MNKQEIENLIEYVKDHSNNFLGSKATLKEKETFEHMYDLLIETLEHQLANRWIPVSDRLPQIRSYEDGEPIEYNIMLKGAEVPTTGCINDDGVWGEMCWAKGIFYPFANEVIAWQPLPEPYKEG